MEPKPSDFLGVQMACMTRLIVHLDERGVADGQAFLAELLQLGAGLPAGQRAVQAMLCDQLQRQLQSSRARRALPTGERH
ncbi:MAG: hypothetical protein KF683_05010 [Rubrivivax sp.]|nr:hypothetical protein [Rubrivivax sp.]